MSMKSQITDAMKQAMRAKDKARLGAIRLMLAEVKRIEVDERIDVDDKRAIVVLDKMCKQRRDSEQQYLNAGRAELAEQESYEIGVIQEFLPAQLTESEILQVVIAAISGTGAQGVQDMGQIMGKIKPQVQGRADMGVVSKLVKQQLSV